MVMIEQAFHTYTKAVEAALFRGAPTSAHNEKRLGGVAQ